MLRARRNPVLILLTVLVVSTAQSPAAPPAAVPGGLSLGGGKLTPLAVTPKVGPLVTGAWGHGGGVWSRSGEWLIVQNGPGKWNRLHTATGRVEAFAVAPGSAKPLGVPIRRDGNRILYHLLQGPPLSWNWLTVPEGGGRTTRMATTTSMPSGRRVLDVRVGHSGPCFLIVQQTRRPRPHETLMILPGSPTAASGMALPALPPATHVVGVSEDWSHVALAPMLSSSEQRVSIRTTSGTPVTLLPKEFGTSFETVFSPDNQSIAFGNVAVPAKGGGAAKAGALVVLPLADPRQVQVLHRGADYYSKPAFSPDGKYIACSVMHHIRKGATVVGHAERMVLFAVKRTTVAGPRPTAKGYTGTGTSGDVLYDFGDPRRVLSVLARDANPSERSSWSADGQSLVHGGRGLLKFDTATGAMTTLIQTDPDPVGGKPVGKVNYWPRIVGNRVVYMPNSGMNVGGQIRAFYLAVPLAGGKPVPYLSHKIGWTLDDVAPGKAGVLLRQWSGIAFGKPQVWHTTDAAAPDMAKLTRQGPLPAAEHFKTLSLNRQRVAMTTSAGKEPWEWRVYDVSGKRVATFPASKQIRSLGLSPDGKYAAVVKGVYGKPQELVVIPLAQPTREYALSATKAECSPPAWSPDGTRIAVIREFSKGIQFGRMQIERKLEIFQVGTLVAKRAPKPHP